MIQFYEYPKCTTCRKGKRFLESHNVDFEAIDMVKSPPTKKELSHMVSISSQPLDAFFNTRGTKYRELDLKNKLSNMSDDEKLDLLTSDGMLIKRPLTTDGKNVVLGFKEETFKDTFSL